MEATTEMHVERNSPHGSRDQKPQTSLNCEPWKTLDTVLHYLHPPAVVVLRRSHTIFAAACEQRIGL